MKNLKNNLVVLVFAGLSVCVGNAQKSDSHGAILT